MAMIIRANGAMEHFTLEDGDDPIGAIQEVVGGDDLPYFLPDGSNIVFNEDGKKDGLPLNKQASNIAIMANGGQLVAFFGDCILFRPGELEELEGDAS